MADTSHILIVDDDPDIRKVLFFLLKDKYFVEEAADGAAAVEYIAAHPETDLVVLDVMMPGMSGYEACGKIRALQRADTVPHGKVRGGGHDICLRQRRGRLSLQALLTGRVYGKGKFAAAPVQGVPRQARRGIDYRRS